MAFGVKQVNQDQFETNDFDILMETKFIIVIKIHHFVTI
jgi:hypothetical protein